MGLTETFQAVAPSVVAIAQTLVHSPDGAVPLSPKILATGFIVDPVGIVATNRHVIECFAEVPIHPRTGKPAVAKLTLTFSYGSDHDGEMLEADLSNEIANDVLARLQAKYVQFRMVDYFP